MRAFLPSTLALVFLSACGDPGARSGARVPGREQPIASATEVGDDAFAGSVQKLLTSAPGTREREALLAGVEARQMVRAASRFRMHRGARGVVAVVGGLYLVKTGELKQGLFGASGYEAMKAASKELASHGDEGRARAAYEILARLAPEADRADVKNHLAALAAWTKDTLSSGGPVAAAGALENVAVTRHLLEPSDVSRAEANQRTAEWIEKALALRAAYRVKRVPPPREEAGEALRALGTGATVLAAIYLRDADAKGALAALDKAQARELARPELLHALEQTIEKPDATKWLEIVHVLRPAPHERDQEEESAEDQEVVRAASFAAAIEAYRLDPSNPEAAGAVAALLEDLGMSEASPAVLVETVKIHPDPRVVGGALGITMHAMAGELDAEEPDAARRVYKAALPLLAAGDDRALAGKLNPTSARVRAMMGEVELREGRLDEARALLTASASAEKLGAVYLSLARIAWHDGKMPVAKDHLRDALAAPDTAKDPALRGEILLTTSDITREEGNMGAARTPLTEALKELARARNTPDGEDRARVERILSRVLDRFGAAQPAQRALERALEAAPRDKRQAAATVGQLVGRAFVKGDLKSARDGLQRGLSAEVEADDLIYYALWVRLLERQLRTPTDGIADRIFTASLDNGRWVGRLAAFGAGLVKAEDLLEAAKTPSQKTEALFYAAMDRRAAGDAKGADLGLKQVMAAGGVDLIEVAITRDLLSGPKSEVGGPLPPGIALP